VSADYARGVDDAASRVSNWPHLIHDRHDLVHFIRALKSEGDLMERREALKSDLRVLDAEIVLRRGAAG
jgi:hypothetical protein